MHLQIPLPPWSICRSFISTHLQTPFFANPFLSHLYKTPGCRGGASGFQLCCRRLARPGRGTSALKNRLTPFLTYSCGLLESLCSLFQPRVLCFQSLADSSCKTPGVWGVGPA